MPVDLQNRLFQYFTDTLAAIVIQAKKSGRFDLGILDLGSGQDDVRRTKLYTFTTRHPTGTAKIELHTFEVERGMTWEEAKDKTSVLFGEHEGFYVSKEVRRIGKLLSVGSFKYNSFCWPLESLPEANSILSRAEWHCGTPWT